MWLTSSLKCSCAGLLVIAIAGCIGTDSQKPLTPPDEAKPAEDMLGTWETGSGNNRSLLTIAKAGDGFPEGMHTVTITHRGKKQTSHFFVSKFGEHRFVNMVTFTGSPPAGWDSDQVERYMLFAVRRVDDELQILRTNREVFRQAIFRDELTGDFVDDDTAGSASDPRIVLNASSDRLRTFFTEQFDRIFPYDPIRLQRVSP